MRWYLLILFFSYAVFCQSLSAQVVWPGDVNNNGVVNGVDVLYWGIAFGTNGPPRATVSSDWQSVPLLSLWAQRFPNELNYAYADCDGNGFVEEDDFDKAIEDNFGLTHGTLLPDGYSNATGGSSPRLRLQPSAEVVEYGATVSISLSLDDADMPVNNFYGLAFTLSYTTGILADDDGIDFEMMENNWIEMDNSLVQDLFVDNNGQGRADFSVTRTNQQSIPVSPGEIGRFSIVIEDIIVGREIDTFHLQIDSIFMIDNQFNIISVVPDTAVIIITKDPKVTATTEKLLQPQVKIFPNPASKEFFLQSNVSVSKLQLTDNLGRRFPLKANLLHTGNYHFSLPPLPPGIYWLSAHTQEGLIGQKIIIINP